MVSSTGLTDNLEEGNPVVAFSVDCTYKSVNQMIEAEKNSKGIVCVCFQNRLNPSTILAKKLIEEDGGARCAYGAIFWFRGASYYTESGWRGKMETEGGGVMINQAIHTIDLMCQILGVPRSVCATVSNHHLKLKCI